MAGFAVGCVGWAILCSVTLSQARSHALKALADSSVISGVDLSQVTRDERIRSQQRDGLSSVIGSLAAADRHLSRPWLLPLRPLPVVGTQLRSADALVSSALSAARAGDSLLTEFDAVRGEMEAESLTPAEAVGRLLPAAQAARTAFAADLGPSSGLLVQLAEARDRLATPLERASQTLEDLTTVLVGFERLLGGSRYLLLVANTSEMRVGSGMYLQAGVATIDETGDVTVAELASVSDPPQSSHVVPIADADTSRHWASMLPTAAYQAVAVSPRFPVVADMAVRMWESSHPERLDGVMALDPSALAAVVTLTGPVVLSDGTSLASADVERFAAYGQYAATEDDVARRELLGELAAQIVSALATVSPGPEQLLEALRVPVQARHLRLWSRDRVVQAAWDRLGAAGDMKPDDLLVSVSNLNGNKLDFLLGVQAALTTTPTPGATAGRRHEVGVTLANRVTGSEPSEVLGEIYPGRYFGILTFHLPRGASQITVDGVPLAGDEPPRGAMRSAIVNRAPNALVLQGPDGPNQLVGVTVELEPGGQHSVRVGFELPAERGIWLVPSARFPSVQWAGVPSADLVPVQLLGDDRAATTEGGG